MSSCGKSVSFNGGIYESALQKETRHDLHSTLHIVSSIATLPHRVANDSKLSVRYEVNNNNGGTISDNSKREVIGAKISINNFSKMLRYEFSESIKRYYQEIYPQFHFAS